MKKLASFLAGILLTFAPVFCTAQGLIPYRLVRPLSSGLTRQIALISQRAWTSPLLFPAKYLPAGLKSYPVLRGALDAKVSQRVFTANSNQLVDLHKLPLKPDQTFEIIQNFKTAPLRQQTDLFLNVFPYLNISRNAPITELDRRAAINLYRQTLAWSLHQNSGSANAWGRDMAAISNLGLYGTATDGFLIVNTVRKAPERFVSTTDIIAARALLGIQAYTNLQELVDLRTVNGVLPAHWQGIAQYAREENLPVQFPVLNTSVPAKPMTQTAETILSSWNRLNLYHSKISAEDTRNWLAQRQLVETSIVPAETVPANGKNTPTPKKAKTGAENAPVSATETPRSSQDTAPTGEEFSHARAENAQLTENTPTFQHQFFKDFSKQPGPLAIFCQTRGIEYQNKSLEEIITLISETPALRENFISMVQHNSSDIVYRLIKGLRETDYITLQTVYPATNPGEEFNAHLGNDILDLFHAITAAPQAAKLQGLLNKGYVFISHFRGKKLFLGTEFGSTEIPALAQQIKEYNQAHGIDRASYLDTFPVTIGNTAVTSTKSSVAIDPHRVFTFVGFNDKVLFSGLKRFLREHPNAKLHEIYYRKTTDIVFTNTRTGQVEHRPSQTTQRPEKRKEALRTLSNLLSQENTRAVLLLDGKTAEENFRFMFKRLEELTPLAEKLFRQKLGKEKLVITYRFGEHEIENGSSAEGFANMHMHLEIRVPSLQFMNNISIPLRASEKTRADIAAKFQEWVENGRPQGSPIEYYGAPSFWERVSQRALPSVFPETSPQQTTAADAPEMYEGELSLGFAF